MKLNMGLIDRVIRVVIAVLIAVAWLAGTIGGVWGVVALAVAGILLVTAFVGFCPLYKPLGISTRKKPAV